jgi:hypothetical protein
VGTEQLTGTWKLVSFNIQHSDGQLTYPWGRDVVGIVMFDAKGHFSAQMMRPDRPVFASGDQLDGTPVEVKSAFEGFVAYYGVYEVRQEDSTITLHVEGGLFPNWVGTAQKRFFEFSGNLLKIRTLPLLWGSQQITVVLTWERAE